MDAKTLAESMLNGFLGYSPEDDACSIAKSYIELAGLVERALTQLYSSGAISTRAVRDIRKSLDSDPAKI